MNVWEIAWLVIFLIGLTLTNMFALFSLYFVPLIAVDENESLPGRVGMMFSIIFFALMVFAIDVLTYQQILALKQDA